ncbi:MAG: choice-of-anchor C family protein [Patescibacteria group bacterium]|nr:choice-of-anchor C family protein [Patescibacteria group bacterium]
MKGKIPMLASAALATAFFVLPAFAFADVSNGSFETGTSPGSFLTLTAPNGTDITNWTVDSGTIDYIGTYWTASNGSRSLDLNGTSTGSISQTFPTIVGAAYKVTFDLSGNPAGGPSLKDVLVSATGAASQHFTYDTAAAGNTLADMKWQPETYSFTATAANTTLTFASQITGSFGPALDNVAVTPVCAPTGFYRDGINMTAAVIDPASPVTGTVDATGCNIGVYFGPGTTGSVTGANIHGANYFGVLVQQAAVDVASSTINQIGENPLNGDQHGVGIYYTTAGNGSAGGNGSCTPAAASTGTVRGNQVTNYQKGGIVANCAGTNVTISGNTVTGQGPVSYIAQNGIQIGFGGTGAITGNTVTNNYCTDADSGDNCTADPTSNNPASDSSAGILLYSPGSASITISNNTLTGNQFSIWSVGAPALNLTGNTITGTSGTTDTGISVWNTDQWGATPAGTTGSVDHNTITDTKYGVLLQDHLASGLNEPAMTVNRNSLAGNTTDGLWTNTSNTIDGTCNWWGNASGPGPVGSGTGSGVTAHATFTPWLSSSDLDGACTGGLPVTVTIDKFIDGAMATAVSAAGDSFPMQSSWNAVNLGGAGSGTYSLGTTGFNSANAYEAVTSPMDQGSTYTTSEVTGGSVVGADCTTGQPYALVGYTTGATEADAAAATPSLTVPNFTNLASNEYVIVWNKSCVSGFVTTDPATNVTSSDATLNGANGTANATGHSFWVSLAPFSTASPTIPSGVYSTPDMGAIAANTAFSATLSSITTDGVPGNLPAITPNTTYYFAAWSLVGGIWYPGAVLNFTTLPPPPPANACSNLTQAPSGYTLVNGTAGNDNVTLAPLSMFVGKGGNDKVKGGDGNYIICEGAGNDTITLGNGDHVINTGGGNNTINTGDGMSTITTGNGNNTIKTGNGDQTVTTGSGNDKITTGSGNDTINAGGGNNTVSSGAGDDTITAGNGNDQVNAGSGTNSCSLGGGHNTAIGC